MGHSPVMGIGPVLAGLEGHERIVVTGSTAILHGSDVSRLLSFAFVYLSIAGKVGLGLESWTDDIDHEVQGSVFAIIHLDFTQ